MILVHLALKRSFKRELTYAVSRLAYRALLEYYFAVNDLYPFGYTRSGTAEQNLEGGVSRYSLS